MKKKNLMSLLLVCGVLVGCGSKTELEVANQTLMVGETREITYTLNPPGLFAQTSLEIVSENPTGSLEIIGMNVRALQVGVATLKATAENMRGASTTFKVSKNFTVTINPITAPEGDFIKNGGFEFGLNEWTFDPVKQYSTEVVDNVSHSGSAALNLWLDEDESGTSDAMDMTLSQTLSNVPIGQYLFAMWYQGTATSVTMSVFDGTTALVTQSFSGFDYRQVPEHHGYVNNGVEVNLTTIKTIRVEIAIVGDAGFWGYVDDVTFKLGTIADLLKAPENAESGYQNMLVNGGFLNNEGWSVSITGTLGEGEGANFNSNKLRIWTKGPATLKIYQTVNLTPDTYNLCVYFNGGEYGSNSYKAAQSQAYAKIGDTTYSLAIEPSGWNSGLMTRVERSNMTLSGGVEVGILIQFDGGTDNWIDIDDLTLWSYNIQ